MEEREETRKIQFTGKVIIYSFITKTVDYGFGIKTRRSNQNGKKKFINTLKFIHQNLNQ